MELLRDNDSRYTLQLVQRGPHLHAYILKMHQPVGDVRVPRIALRYDLIETFRSQREAYSTGLVLAKRMIDGELSAARSEVSKKVEEHKLIGSAVFQLATEKWEPTLRIVSRKKENKGAVQDLSTEQTPLQRNTFSTPERATEYALEHGERLVLGLVPGLRV